MSKEIIHSIVLIVTILITFLYPNTSLAKYDLQITALLFIFLFLIKKWVVKDSTSKLIESVIFTLVVMGAVNSTGGMSSPFFFLIYFLLFSLSLLLEPIISITITLVLIAIFFYTLPANQSFNALLPILSLAFITPFALFLGNLKTQNDKLKADKETQKEDTFLFLSLLMKNHLKNIKDAVENYVGDHELSIIHKSVTRMEKLIEKYEKSK